MADRTMRSPAPARGGGARTIAWALGFTIVAALLTGVMFTSRGCHGPGLHRDVDGRETVTIDGHAFHLEVAADDATRIRGLMGRDTIPEDGGMLFIFPDMDVRAFWMGNCLTDIDIIFLDGRGRVTATHRMKAQPPRGADEPESAYRARMPDYPSVYPSQFAIELRSGWLDRLDLHVEDRIDLDTERLKRLAR